METVIICLALMTVGVLCFMWGYLLGSRAAQQDHDRVAFKHDANEHAYWEALYQHYRQPREGKLPQ